MLAGFWKSLEPRPLENPELWRIPYFTGAYALRGNDMEGARKLFDEARKSVNNEINKVLTESQEKFLAGVLKAVEGRLGKRLKKVEDDLKARDKKIADLQAKVKKLQGELAKAAPPKADIRRLLDPSPDGTTLA